MKKIKSIFSLVILLSGAMEMQAQQPKTAALPQVKTEVEKPVDVKYPARDKPTAAPSAQSATPSTPAPVAPVQKAEVEKLEALTLNKNDISKPGGEKGAKILAGKTTAPADPAFSPSTVDPTPAPQVAKPANKVQQ